MHPFMIFCCCSLAEQLDLIRESLDAQGISALTLFLDCKKVGQWFLFFVHESECIKDNSYN